MINDVPKCLTEIETFGVRNCSELATGLNFTRVILHERLLLAWVVVNL